LILGLLAMTNSPSVPSDSTDRILCYYANATNELQRVCIKNSSNGCFERIIFPGQRVFFEARPDALLEIHARTSANTTLLDQIPCHHLRVNERIRPFDRPDVVELL
jgi:Domain of unknown function (DUF1830)